MTNEKLTRAFLAIEIPAEIREGIRDIQGRLKALKLKGIRWTSPEGIHLTLKFLGNISKTDILNVSTVVEKQTKCAVPFMLDVETVGMFPDLKRPRVVWLGIRGETESLFTLQRKIDEALDECGFERETRPFRPHLTLGRIKSPVDARGIAQAIREGRDFAAGRFQATGLALYKSELTPEGAIYTKLSSFTFGG